MRAGNAGRMGAGASVAPWVGFVRSRGIAMPMANVNVRPNARARFAATMGAAAVVVVVPMDKAATAMVSVWPVVCPIVRGKIVGPMGAAAPVDRASAIRIATPAPAAPVPPNAAVFSVATMGAGGAAACV